MWNPDIRIRKQLIAHWLQNDNFWKVKGLNEPNSTLPRYQPFTLDLVLYLAIIDVCIGGAGGE